jgi:hypothetical protein
MGIRQISFRDNTHGGTFAQIVRVRNPLWQIEILKCPYGCFGCSPNASASSLGSGASMGQRRWRARPVV